MAKGGHSHRCVHILKDARDLEGREAMGAIDGDDDVARAQHILRTTP